ncbi:hypothetical protein ACKP2L_06970 [Oenococcus alcoholitolerans]|uniref:Uncharacterized protein n=1 Tax=Oenococcus alcoholitolerans TaxID=931074 RepID=A0ABR4XQJ6_9LACO|nr:hypothetical protein Q757_05290 [Oenococcus alcoholitolerans]
MNLTYKDNKNKEFSVKGVMKFSFIYPNDQLLTFPASDTKDFFDNYQDSKAIKFYTADGSSLQIDTEKIHEPKLSKSYF